MQLLFKWLTCVWLLTNGLWPDSVNAETSANVAFSPPPAPLRDLTGEVLAHNPAILAARARLDTAKGREQAATRPIYNPELALDVEDAATRTNTIGINQTIDWGNKQGGRQGVASHEVAAARASLNGVLQRVAGELCMSLGRYQTALSRRVLAQRRASLMNRFSDLAGKRRRAGDLNQVDFELAQLAATQAQLQLAQADADRISAVESLAILVGEDRQDWPSLPESLPVIRAFDAETLVSDQPRLQAQKARIAAARSKLALRVRAQSPDPTIGIRGGRDGSEQLIGLSLSIPLFVRNNYRAEVDIANAELIQKQREGQGIYQRARAQLTSAEKRYQIARKAWLLWQNQGQPSIDKQVDILERLWRAGELSTTAYLVQLNQTINTRAEALLVRERLWNTWIDWLVSSARINQWLKINIE